MPGLDGLRALAVAAVIAYHLGFGWASGGLLGVGVFFTLSGYLITDLLLGQLADRRLRLTEFWLRRARRLLPGLFVMLVIVTVWVWVADRSQLAALRGQLASAVFYFNNWWQISQHVSYFARFGPPSPLNHLWSLSVEEQFYIFWPWLLLLGVHFVKEGRQRFRSAPPARRRDPGRVSRFGDRDGGHVSPQLRSLAALRRQPTPAPSASCSGPPWRWCGPAAS